MATQILGKVAYTSRGAYDSSFLYEINDVVTYNGSSYVSLKETKGNLPSNENYWMLLAQKGDTYEVTENDLNNIANQITEDANSLFNQNVETKTEEFNTNVSNKTNDFNSNVTSKTETFNTNAETKTTSFNENATTKLNTYDENATTKLSEYNTNADERLQEFNGNADSYNERITANENNIAENTQRTRRIEKNIFESGEATGESINIQDSVLSELTGFKAKAVNTKVTGENIPNPDNPQAIPVVEAGEEVEFKSIGKNFTKLEYLKLMTGSDGTISQNANTYCVLVNTTNINTLSISGDYSLVGDNVVRVGLFNEYPTIGVKGARINTGSTVESVDTTKYKYCLFSFLINGVTEELIKQIENSFQIEASPIVTNYEAYIESKLTTSVPENEFVGATDTTADEFYTEYNEEDKKEHIYLAKNVGRRVLNGTEGWSIQQSGTDNYFYQLYLGAKTLINASCISSHYTTNFISTSNTNEGIYNTTESFRIRYGAEKTLEEWKAQLTENNVTVLYGLVNPYVIDLGAIDSLKTYTDVTNILNNSSIPFNMTANYYRNFISTIRNLQINNGALQTELANLENRLSALETSVSNIQTSQVNESEVVE